MELIVAILIALGSLTSEKDFTKEYESSHQGQISKAKSIIDQGQYKEKDGGVIIIDSGGGL